MIVQTSWKQGVDPHADGPVIMPNSTAVPKKRGAKLSGRGPSLCLPENALVFCDNKGLRFQRQRLRLMVFLPLRASLRVVIAGFNFTMIPNCSAGL